MSSLKHNFQRATFIDTLMKVDILYKTVMHIDNQKHVSDLLK